MKNKKTPRNPGLTLKEVITEMGEDYMGLVRECPPPSELARMSDYTDCDVCGRWLGHEDLGYNSAMGNVDLNVCQYCVDHGRQRVLKSVRQELVRIENE